MSPDGGNSAARQLFASLVGRPAVGGVVGSPSAGVVDDVMPNQQGLDHDQSERQQRKRDHDKPGDAFSQVDAVHAATDSRALLPARQRIARDKRLSVSGGVECSR
jgi:hypothetical protein